MLIDNLLVVSNAQAITSTAASTSDYDTAGAGYGNPVGLLIGNATVFGDDVGQGDGAAAPVYATLAVTTAFVSAGGATLQVQLQGGADNGSNAVSTWYTIVETDALSVAQLTALYQKRTLNIPLPPRTAGEPLPRFYSINYVVGTSTFSAGAVTAWFGLGPDTAPFGIYPANYVAN